MALSHIDFSGFHGMWMKLWDAEMKKKTDYRPLFFDMRKTDKRTETHYGVGAASEMKAWQGTVSYDTIEALYPKSYVQGKYSSGLIFERELFEYKEWNQMKDKLIALNNAVYKSEQGQGASLFNKAFSDAVAGGDAVGLCSAAHPYSPSDAAVQNNEGVLDLTVGNLDLVEQAMMDFKDNRGDIIGIEPNAIIVGNKLLRDAERIVGSKAEAWVADNTKNVYSGYRVLHNPRITGNKWFVVDDMRMKEWLKWYTGREPKLERFDEFDTEAMKYKVVGRWAFGWDTWQWIYGNNA